MRWPPLFTSRASWPVKWPPGDQTGNNKTHLGQRWRLESAWRRWQVEGWPHTHTDTPPSSWHSTNTSTQTQEHRKVVTSLTLRHRYNSEQTAHSILTELCCHVMQARQPSLSARRGFPREGRSSRRNVQLCPPLLLTMLLWSRNENIIAIAIIYLCNLNITNLLIIVL